jgi:hypothetical protein
MVSIALMNRLHITHARILTDPASGCRIVALELGRALRARRSVASALPMPTWPVGGGVEAAFVGRCAGGLAKGLAK